MIANPGDYVGYTQGGGTSQKPTLYFTKGHLTQEHKNAGKVGWHPFAAGIAHIRVNVSPEDNIETITEGVQNSAVKPFVNQYLKAKEIVPTSTFLFEYELDASGKKMAKTRKSRGKMLRPTDVDFNPVYNEAYALNRLKAAKSAAKYTKV